MKNTLENKAKFFALYWGKNVLYVGGVGLVEIGNGGWNIKHSDFFIQLTPLSQITDEDAIEVLKLLNVHNFGTYKERKGWVTDAFLENIWSHNTNSVLEAADYIRSKGYALPYMGLSVEKQIEYGWIKLNDL